MRRHTADAREHLEHLGASPNQLIEARGLEEFTFERQGECEPAAFSHLTGNPDLPAVFFDQTPAYRESEARTFFDASRGCIRLMEFIKNRAVLFKRMPIPVSLTEISTDSSSWAPEIDTIPDSGVNFTALLNRL